jgi:hypothetical protein
MSFEEFRQSIERDATPPPGLDATLQALWHDARGDWESAHRVAQEDHRAEGSWVHAYLHRKEGDIGNAGYWYSRAGRKTPGAGITLDHEWTDMVRALLAK